MARTFYLYTDAGLTTQFTGTLYPSETSNQYLLYFGSPDDTRRAQANSDPGTGQITLTPADSNPGSNHEATEIKLALTEGGLGSATGGAALNIGTTIAGGTANKVAIHILLTDSTGGAAGVDTELSITFNEIKETSIP